MIVEINRQKGLKYITEVQDALLRQNFLPIKIVSTSTHNKSTFKDILHNQETIFDISLMDIDGEIIKKIPYNWAINDTRNLVNA